nr:reverse transcriptase domain-containing protein [Tanacetum cinerariifolium]
MGENGDEAMISTLEWHGDTLASLGANINLMAYSMYSKLFVDTLKPTRMTIHLVIYTYQYPVRVAENMLVKARKFIFPIEFVILEMQEDSRVPLILGRPFLHTTNAIIRVKNKELNLEVGDDIITFPIDKAIKHSYSNDDTCFRMDVIDETRLAVYKFEGDALAWWKAYKQAKGSDVWLITVTWAEFKELFFLQFFPRAEQESAGTTEEQAKNFQWGLRKSTLNHLMCIPFTDVAQVANAARNYEILHERDDDGTERPDKRQKSGDRHQPTTQQSSHMNHGHNNDLHGSDRQGSGDNHRSNNNYSGNNNRSSGNGRD